VLHPPVEVIRPARVPKLPATMPGGIQYQVKLDGWRVVAFVDEAGVTLQTRSGRIVTERFPEITPALATREPGTVLDGEIVAWREGAFDFQAVSRTVAQRRRSNTGISYIAFDLLCEHGTDIRAEPLNRRWPRLREVLAAAPTELQTVMATEDRREAESWMTLLAPVGMEGLVCKALASPYRNVPGAWVKVRHSDTVDAELIGAIGPAARPHVARVRLTDGRELTTLGLTDAQAAAVGRALAAAGGGGDAEGAEAAASDDVQAAAALSPVSPTVEITLSGDRHPRATFVRIRHDV
jgi:ATP-dependent DNA ligase